MNTWIEKSRELALTTNYLDKIQEVYPAGEISDRDIPSPLIREIVNAHTSKDKDELLTALLKLEKFPVQDPRVAFLRRGRGATNINPQTKKSLGQSMLNIPIDELLKLCKQGKATNTKMGNMFHSWLFDLSYKKLKKNDFEKSKNGIIIMDGSPSEWRKFADNKLRCGLNKDPDLLMKVDDKYIVGEAKWLGDFGGNQNKAFTEAVQFIHSAQGNATRIAILDGVVWLDTGNRMNREIKRVEAIAMSALLLTDFLE